MQHAATARNRSRSAAIPLTAQARLLSALAHPARLALVAALRTDEACACHLAATLRQARPYVSQQLAILRQAGLITGRRDGTFIYYRLRDYAVLAMLDLASGLSGMPEGSLAVPRGCRCPRCRVETGDRDAR